LTIVFVFGFISGNYLDTWTPERGTPKAGRKEDFIFLIRASVDDGKSLYLIPKI
jgi:hypothetical protein